MILFRDEPNKLTITLNDVTPNPAWIHSRLTGRATNGVAIADIISDITRLTPHHSTQCTFLPQGGSSTRKISDIKRQSNLNSTSPMKVGRYT